MDNSFKIGEVEFKVRKLDAFKQFHIVRRIAPLLTDLLPVLQNAKKFAADQDKLSETEKFEQVAQFAGPIISGLSKLSDTESEFVLNGLLSAIEMQQETGNWARVVVGNQLMIQNLELPVLLQAAGQAFMFNLQGFFSALPRQA